MEIKIGTVLYMLPGNYTARVVLDTEEDITCIMGGGMINKEYGISESSILPPNTRVLVVVDKQHSKDIEVNGCIISSIPNDGVFKDKIKVPQRNSILDKNTVSQINVSSYKRTTISNESFNNTEANSERARDVLVGDELQVNKFGVGRWLSAFSTGLSASPKASIGVGLIDDLVEINAGYLKETTSLDDKKVFNDGGRLSEEYSFSLYQTERFGEKELNSEAINADHEIIESKKPISRLKIFKGFLGSLFSLFVTSPDEEDTEEDDVENGLTHFHIGEDGSVFLNAASEIFIEHTDRIPVPKRIKEPSDPSGYKAEDDSKYDKKEDFDYDYENPDEDPNEAYADLFLRDRIALKIKNAYHGFRKLIDKDFKLKSDEDLNDLKDKYDTVSKSVDAKEKYKKRRSGIYFSKDGRIYLRSAWGSEIIIGDNIEISGVHNIFTRSGQHIISLAGDSNISKAYKDIEMSTTDGDIKIKSEYNFEVLSNKGRFLFVGKDEENSRMDVMTNHFSLACNELLMEEGLSRLVFGERQISSRNRYKEAVSGGDLAEPYQNEVRFKFKKSEDYGNFRLASDDDEINSLNQPFWVTQYYQNNELLIGTIAFTNWEEKPIDYGNEDDKSYPWPGKEFYEDDDKYIVLDEEVNWKNASDIKGVTSEDLKLENDKTRKVSLNEYHIRGSH